MKTIANIMNSQNVKPEHLLAVIITSAFKEENSVSVWTSSTEVASTGLPKLPLNDLKSLRHRLAELHAIQVITWNISVCSFLDICSFIFDTHACSYHIQLQLQWNAQ